MTTAELVREWLAAWEDVPDTITFNDGDCLCPGIPPLDDIRLNAADGIRLCVCVVVPDLSPS
jgi:hypothetical protein